MAGDWAYDELLPIAAVELTILVWLLRCALIVAVICWFPLPERAPQGRYAVAYLQLVRLRRRATRFLIGNCLSYIAFGSKGDGYNGSPTQTQSRRWVRAPP